MAELTGPFYWHPDEGVHKLASMNAGVISVVQHYVLALDTVHKANTSYSLKLLSGATHNSVPHFIER